MAIGRAFWVRAGLGLVLAVGSLGVAAARAQAPVTVSFSGGPGSFTLAGAGRAVPLVVEGSAPETERLAANCFAGDVELVTGVRPVVTASVPAGARAIVLVGVAGQSALLDALERAGKLDLSPLRGKWESSVTALVADPMPGVRRALVIAGSDRRGAAFALFTLSRQMGVSPWTWWADVLVPHREAVFLNGQRTFAGEPSVRYRGIFLNDEDFGLRPWAAKKMDPEVGNLGPHTYARLFELLLRLHADSLWPAMHPGTAAFNSLPQNAVEADRWGILMGSSHSEALLRNNVGEWNEKTDGPWNYQINRAAIDAYWKVRVQANGRYENFYTVGMRGVHDSGLEATGTVEQKARLVEQVMTTQRALLRQYVGPDLSRIPQVFWLYKESLELYRAGMEVPPDVTLGWTDDNWGYIRQLSTVAEQRRPGGSGLYYHVSYWGLPTDYLWLCTTPPALMREELTKAFDHEDRRYWILNVGDLKPAEMDTDYFLQLAYDMPGTRQVEPDQFVEQWLSEQMPGADAHALAAIMDDFYRLSFIRKADTMGFNGYSDGIKRTLFNPLAWGNQNQQRLAAWEGLSRRAQALGATLPRDEQAAFFELVGYPVEASAAQNAKFLYDDRTYLDVHDHRSPDADAAATHAAYAEVQRLTAEYNGLLGGKWNGMMSSHPGGRHVYEDPATATTADAGKPLPPGWAAPVPGTTGSGPGFHEVDATVSIGASDYAACSDRMCAASYTGPADPQDGWHRLPGLGVSGPALEYGRPGLLGEQPSAAFDPAKAPWVEYRFTTSTAGDATLHVGLLPTFPIDSDHKLRFAVTVDGGAPRMLDASGLGEWREGNAAPVWAQNVLRNLAELTLPLPGFQPGPHTVRLFYVDPAVVFENLTVTLPGAAPAYPAAPETR